jgi:hypothetical protein
MALRLIYQVFTKLLGWIVLRTRSDTTKDIEILILRHQLAVLQRRTPRPRMSWTDRALIAAFTRLLPVRRRLGLLVTPATILRWHRQLIAHRWTTRPVRLGRPAIPAGLRALVLSMATENPTWGYRRDHGERDEHRPTARPTRWTAPPVSAGRVTCAAILPPTGRRGWTRPQVRGRTGCTNGNGGSRSPKITNRCWRFRGRRSRRSGGDPVVAAGRPAARPGGRPRHASCGDQI